MCACLSLHVFCTQKVRLKLRSSIGIGVSSPLLSSHLYAWPLARGIQYYLDEDGAIKNSEMKSNIYQHHSLIVNILQETRLPNYGLVISG